ncbi:hypothetical protein CMO90_03765, partial [Candidatus Woesearchaeota archaeon]|nr:hypothetical protein [Candidatus Woesearchaeota archaeon]
QVQIDLTNVCNHDCIYCVYRYEEAEDVDFDTKQFIKTPKVIELLEDIKSLGVKAVVLQGGGEPFVHLGIVDVIRKVDELGLEYGVITNGTAIKEKHIPILKNAKWIRFSVDAATDETYEQVQRTKNNIPKKTIKNIKEQNNKTVVGLSFLSKPENFHEVYEFAIMAKKLGVDNIRYSIVQTLKGNDIMKPFYKKYFKLLKKSKSLETNNFRIFGLKERSDALKNKKNYDICYYQHFTTSIAANGKVYPCCWTKNIAKFSLGNINERSFKEIWLGKNREEKLRNQDLKECPPCWFDKTNELLNYLMKEEPEHVNFV